MIFEREVYANVEVDIELEEVLERLNKDGIGQVEQWLKEQKGQELTAADTIRLCDLAQVETLNMPLPYYLRELLSMTFGRDFGVPQ
ncbi:hypothetical protein [Eikenella sp. NML120348]|uniref:hypothetical protein n=1 Tax=Eikenella sp. NML120348 TaxID=1795831 RepID=UPI0007DFB196|nr:hypothetical protein [Eikenella sp. NML120348]OAM37804.1 hypothetical protein A7P99_05345 [Eikenella sp. NML120348]